MSRPEQVGQVRQRPLSELISRAAHINENIKDLTGLLRDKIEPVSHPSEATPSTDVGSKVDMPAALMELWHVQNATNELLAGLEAVIKSIDV